MVGNLIYCFTGTGNSLAIANDIQKELKNMEIKAINKKTNCKPDLYDTIGFVFPTYFFGMPLIVEEFMRKLDVSKNMSTYFYAILTCGGSVGSAFGRIKQILEEKSVTLHYANKIVMTENYIIMYKIKEKTEDERNQFQLKRSQFIADLKERKIIKIQNESVTTKLLHKIYEKTSRNADRHFNVNEKCDGCTICAKVCPVNNIEMYNKRPVFKHNCQQCLACLHYCPQEAINYKNKTQKKLRYQNKDVLLKDRIKFK